MIIQPTFWEALHLGDYNPPIISIVGAGGKTSLLYRLGEEAIATNRSALLSGTTLFTLPKKEIASQQVIEQNNENLLNILTKVMLIEPMKKHLLIKIILNVMVMVITSVKFVYEIIANLL